MNYAAQIVIRIINLYQLLMLLRAVGSWFALPRAIQPVYQFIYVVTEPIIIPFRALLRKMSSGRSMMIDISFLLAVLALELVNTILYRVFL